MLMPNGEGGGAEREGCYQKEETTRKPRAVYLVQQRQPRPGRPLVLPQQRSRYPRLL
jgi:hypothetical protein